MKKYAILIILFFPLNQALASECKKMVFDKFCLGGSIEAQIQKKKPINMKNYGSLKAIMYKIGSHKVYISGFKGKIISVVKFYDNPSWLRFNVVKNQLNKIYGKSKNESYFPRYAKTPESKATTISIGKAQARYRWKFPEWNLVLSWSDNKVFILSYNETKLTKEYLNSNPDKL